MRNLEAKFRIDDLERARAAALAIGFEPRGILEQRDTFFVVASGKLKLREEGDRAWLIGYGRVDAGGLDVSNYDIVEVGDAGAMRGLLGRALGVLAEVPKRRIFLMRRNVRLHLDSIDELGTFGEIEAVVDPGSDPETYRVEAEEILGALGIDFRNLIHCSYFELMASAGKAKR